MDNITKNTLLKKSASIFKYDHMVAEISFIVACTAASIFNLPVKATKGCPFMTPKTLCNCKYKSWLLNKQQTNRNALRITIIHESAFFSQKFRHLYKYIRQGSSNKRSCSPCTTLFSRVKGVFQMAANHYPLF